MNQLRLFRINYEYLPGLEQFEDRTIFQTIDWIKFVAKTQSAEPVFAAVKKGDYTVGRFSGLIFKKYGLRILGSPFPGWTTSYMGFNVDPSVSRLDALLALENFAFRDLGCIHVEIMDRRLCVTDFQLAGYNYRFLSGCEIDLSVEREALLAAMKPTCRQRIRKADKIGVKLEIAKDFSFADDYYAQLEDVFAKQKLVPTYTKERVRALIEYLLPSGQLLLVRARDPEGRCIGTGIFPAFNDTMYFWGGASWRPYQKLSPNEAIQWFAMLYWKSRGITRYDMGGAGEYKRKYGGSEIPVPWGRKSKYPIFENLRNIGKQFFKIKQKTFGLQKQ